MAVKRYSVACALLCIIGIGLPVNSFAETAQTMSESAQNMMVSSSERMNISTLTRQMNQYGFSEDEILPVRDMVDVNGEEAVVVTSVIEKIYEGMAKGVGNEGIMYAVEQVRNRYREAYRQAAMVSGESDQTLMLANLIAESFTAGLMAEDCESILSQLRQRIRTMKRQEAYDLIDATMLTARNLARSRVRSATVEEMLSSALRQQYEAQEMVMLQERFQSRTRYDSAESVASNFAENIGRGVPASQLGGKNGRDGGDDTREEGGSTVGGNSDNGEKGAANDKGGNVSSGETGSSGSSGSSSKGGGSSAGSGSSLAGSGSSGGSTTGSGNSNQAGSANTNTAGAGQGHGGQAGKKK